MRQAIKPVFLSSTGENDAYLFGLGPHVHAFTAGVASLGVERDCNLADGSMASLVAMSLTLLGQASALSPSDSSITARQTNSAASDYVLYTVKSGDTCVLILRAHDASYCQVITWNPDINSACS